MLTIEIASGGSILFTSRELAHRQKSGFSRVRGLQDDDQVTFTFERPLRKRLEELYPHAGKNVTQTINRAKIIQLTSTKPCSFVRFVWDGPRFRAPGSGWNELYSFARMEGVFTISTASIGQGNESTSLTLYRGNWLWKPDGSIENFDRAGVPT